jgi:hypothetical protein
LRGPSLPGWWRGAFYMYSMIWPGVKPVEKKLAQTDNLIQKSDLKIVRG